MTRILLAVLTGCGLAGPAAAQPKTDDAVARVLADWQARQGKVKTARYVLAGTYEYIAPIRPGDSLPPPDARVQPVRATLLLDLERGRYRQETSGHLLGSDGKVTPTWATFTYDGSETRQSSPPELVPHGGYNLIIGKRNDAERGNTSVQNEYLPVFFAHGIVPTVHTPVIVQRLPRTHDPEDWLTVGRRPLGGRTFDVFRTEPLPAAEPLTDEVWVDPDREGAVRRFVDLVGGRPWLRLDIDWRQTPAGWWPERWTETFTADGKTTNVVQKWRVESYEYDPPVADADFTIPVEPGMERVRVVELVPPGTGMDPGRPPYRVYRITTSGEWVETEAKGATTRDGTELPPRRWWDRWPWAAGVVGLAAVGGWAWRARRHATKTG
ncbi:MAG: hypothetical protein K2X87_00170 [Gemmataceae bacterium]|nr:hypothetical protein [Gemmataceae bacterium]